MKDYGVVSIIKRGNKYLLLKESRKPMHGKWAPSYGVCEDRDKTQKGTIKREVYEDTKLKVKPIRKIWSRKRILKSVR